MAFWNKKKIVEEIKKYLQEQNVNYKEESGYLTFEIYFKKCEYSIYPYIMVFENTEEVSFLVNLRKWNQDLQTFQKINAFNVSSKYFTAKIKDSIILLEYNCFMTAERVEEELNFVIETLFALQEEIDKL